MALTYQQEKTGFLRGTRKELRVGGYGGTVTLEAGRNSILIRTTKPKRRQVTVPENTRQAREASVDWAEDAVEEALKVSPRAVRVPEAPRGEAVNGSVTPREIWLYRLRKILGKVPPEVFRWTRRNVVARFEAMNPHARAQKAAVDTVCGVILAARRLHEVGALRLDVAIKEINPDDIVDWVEGVIEVGGSPHTPKSYISRFRTAARAHKERFPDRWKGIHDPARLVVIETSHIEPPEISEAEARTLIIAAWEAGEWRIIAALVIAHETGRRIGAIGAHRSGQHIDAPPLTAGDIHEDPSGRMMVTWRAKAAKGGRLKNRKDDVTLLVTETLATVLRWVRDEHPNPLGADHPLIWDEQDPAKAVGYDGQNRSLNAIWQKAFGEERPSGTAFHAFCRTAITTLAELVGVPDAAEYTGRTKETAVKYLRVRDNAGGRSADALDRARNRTQNGPDASFGANRRAG